MPSFNSFYVFINSVQIVNLIIKMRLTETQRIEVLIMIGYGNRTRTQQEVCELFNQKYPDRPPISQSTVSKIEKKFHQIGNVRDAPKTGRPSVSEEKQLDVLLNVRDQPHVTSRELASELNISKTAVLKTLHVSKYHPYKMQVLQELYEDDYDRRMEFCERLQVMCFEDQHLVKNIVFSDESTFNLNGEVNTQNYRYWSDVNPHWMREGHTQYKEKINVWAGIVGNTVIGPIFFEENLTGDRYLRFLQDDLIPALATLFPGEANPDLPNANIWFQQDGAPPHYAADVRAYLNEIFPNRWIGRRGAIEWPPRSPDLTPLDFFLWGYIKGQVFKTKPTDLDDLKIRITQEIRRITPEVINNVQGEFINRLGYCQLTIGRHFEHLLKRN